MSLKKLAKRVKYGLKKVAKRGKMPLEARNGYKTEIIQ